jgi:uncharacterized protein YjbI with pentapeptide repeats
MASKKYDSIWQGIIGRRLPDHRAYIAANCQGSGQMILEDMNLQGAELGWLEHACLKRCDLSGLRLQQSASLKGSEFVDCLFVEAELNYSRWIRTQVRGCCFTHAFLGLVDFDDAVLERCDFSTANLERAQWPRASVRDCNLSNTNLASSIFDDAWFTNCNFQHATLNHQDTFPDLSRCPNTRFINCDFRGANLTGLRLNNTTFDRCKFHGIIGTPVLEGDITLIAPDFSPNADGSDIRKPKAVVKAWQSR